MERDGRDSISVYLVRPESLERARANCPIVNAPLFRSRFFLRRNVRSRRNRVVRTTPPVSRSLCFSGCLLVNHVSGYTYVVHRMLVYVVGHRSFRKSNAVIIIAFRTY